MSILCAENIVKEYRNQLVLNGASIRVARGERLALIGANGSGKTTLLRILMGLEQPDQGTVIKAKQIRIGYLSQDFYEISKDGSRTALEYEKLIRLEQQLRAVEAEMREASGSMGESDEKATQQLLNRYQHLVDRYESLDGYNFESRMKSTLLGLGLREEALTIPLSALSGGEKTRAAIARLLLEEPDLLILDEPTNHLDIEAIEWLENFLKRFQGGVLFVSHDRYFLDQVATRVAELAQGTITERSGSYTTFIQQKQIRQEFMYRERKRLNQQIKEADRLVQDLKGKAKARAAKSKEKTAERLRRQLAEGTGRTIQREHLAHTGQLRLNVKQAGHISSEIARAEGLCKRFGTVSLFEGAEFLISGGQRVGIVGPNGCGKTTLLNILMGRDSDYTGFARLGQWVHYGYIGQEITFEDESRTLLEEILHHKEMLEKEARRYLANYQFYGDQADKAIHVLSGGEKVRLRLAVILLDEPHCLILDEPTNHLDVPARDALEEALLSFRGTVIAVSHDRYFLTRCAQRVLEVSDGRIHSYEGNYEVYKQLKAKQNSNTPSSADTHNQGPVVKQKSQDTAQSTHPEADHAALEARITALEEELKQMEASFNQDTPYDVYEAYQEKMMEVNELYKTWAD
jgi:ATP-binding cassette subfamily F protein 3